MEQEQLFYVGIKGLIKNAKGQFLLLLADVTTHRKNTQAYWDIPGGRIQQGGTVLATLEREIEEETGVAAITEVRFLTAVVSNHMIPMDNGGEAGLVLMIYKVTIPGDASISLSVEHSRYEWVSPVEAMKRLAHKYPPEFIDQL